MLKSYKTEISPTPGQKQITNRTTGVCRHVYNPYLSHNNEVYGREKKFISGMCFSKWLNKVYLLENPDKEWIKEVSSKSVKQSIMNTEKAFKRFFRHQSGFPKFKKKGKPDVKMYFVKNHVRSIKFETQYNLQLSFVCIKTDGCCARARIFRTGVRSRYVNPRSGT